jgi:hypothetical protein
VTRDERQRGAGAGIVRELRKLARAEGDDFEVVWDGLRVAVSYTPGSSRSVLFAVPYDAPQRAAETGFRDPARLHAVRPMKVVLAPERPEHVRGKAAGVDVEHQTGDPMFDRRVYIDAPSAEPLPHLLRSPVVRAAVLRLFEQNFQLVEIDDDAGRITARSTSFVDPRPATGTHGRDALAAFVDLARALPPVFARQGKHPDDPLRHRSQRLFAIAFGIFLIGAPASCISLGGECGDDIPESRLFHCLAPGAIGLVSGLVVSLVVRAIVHPGLEARYSGTSSSSRRIETYSIALGLVVFIGIMVTVAGALALAHVF